MKKIIAFILIISFSLFLGGCFKKKVQEAEKNLEPEGGLVAQEDSTLMDWLKRGKGVECTLATGEGQVLIRSKNNKVRIDGIPYIFGAAAGAEQIKDGVSVTDGDWTYMWSGSEGMKMNSKKMQELSADDEQVKNAEDNQWESRVEEWQKIGTDYKCSEKTLSDSLFEVPSDVEFVDLTEMMAELSEIGQNLEKQMEAGEPIDMEAMEKAMNDLRIE